MLTIRWNDGDAEGTTDLLPDHWFSRIGEEGFRQHVVAGVEGRTGHPRCAVTVGETVVDLDYGGEHRAHNVEHGYAPGVMRLTFADPSRASIPAVTWKDDGQDDFVRHDVQVDRQSLPAKDARPFDPKNRDDGRRKIEQMVAVRQGQSDFRDALLSAYQGRCAITDCSVEEVLQAAHILPYRNQGMNHVTNGLLLRADIHTLFDLGIIKIIWMEGEYRISAPSSIRKSFRLPGKIINLPTATEDHPSPEAFQEKWVE